MSITILNKTLLIETSPRYTNVEQLSRIELNVLNNLFLDQLLIQVQKHLNENPGISNNDLQIEADIIASSLILTTLDKDQEIIEKEALEISKEKLINKLSLENLPIPNNLNLHAIELAKDETILAEAKFRIEARLRAGFQLINKGI